MGVNRKPFADCKVPPWVWNVTSWALALGVFTFAMVQSYRVTQETTAADLRTPAVLLLDAFLGAAVAFGFAARESALRRWADLRFCFRYGLWSAAVFRLLPPSINETGLYFRNSATFDVPYTVLGACIHGGLTVLFAWPYAIRVLYPEGRPLWTADESVWQMGGTAILIFYIVAGAVRLLAAFA